MRPVIEIEWAWQQIRQGNRHLSLDRALKDAVATERFSFVGEPAPCGIAEHWSGGYFFAPFPMAAIAAKA